MAKEKMSIRLSIIVPVYNVEQYLRRALDSLVGQTYKNIEIILVDDGSTDDSGKICDEYASQDERIMVIHKENGGIVSARKAAVAATTGDYIINFDSDDWIEADAYECVVQKIETYHPDIVAFGYTKEYEDFTEKYPLEFSEGYYSSEEFWRLFNDSVDKNLFFKQPIDMSQWDKAIKAELIKKHQLNCSEKLKKNVDDAVIFPCLLEMKDIYIDSGCWYHYCVRKSSILWKNDAEDYSRYLRLAKYLLTSIQKSEGKSKVSKEFVLYKILHHLILDVPEKMFSHEKCLIYPEIQRGSRIIVYGKGVFANRMMARIEDMQYCQIVDNIDSSDVERINQIDRSQYDYIVVAVFNSRIVNSILNTLNSYNVDHKNVLIIDKKNLSADILPDEIRFLYENI